MKKLKSRLNGIIEIIKTDDGYIVLENPIIQSDSRFPSIGHLVNLYKVGKDFQLIWDAELPRKDDRYYGTLNIENGQLKVFSGDFRCFIDLLTGKILSKHPNM